MKLASERHGSASLGNGLRADAWHNHTTGIGTWRDKTTHGRFHEDYLLNWQELLALYNGSDLMAKIVSKPAEEMFRRGYELKIKDADTDDLQAFQKDAQTRLRADEMFEQGETWGPLFGGALLIVGADDGQTPDQPLNMDRIKTVRFLNLVDRRFAWVLSYYSDPFSPNYGLPEKYLISNMVANAGWVNAGGPGNNPMGPTATAVVHESRCIRFDGNATDILTRQRLAGWTLPSPQRVYDVLRRFDHGFDSVGHLLSDASQGVFKLQGLIEAISNGQKDDLDTRMALVDMQRSVARMMLVDSEGEDFHREATSFAGIPDVLDRYMQRLAAAADMPVSVLFGRSAAGLNATGDNEIRAWYDAISSKQSKRLGPKLRRFYQILAAAKDSLLQVDADDLEIEFHPLWAPSDAEQADVDLKRAQTRASDVGAQIVSVEEAALTPDVIALYPEMDQDGRRKAMESAEAFKPHEADLAAATAQQGQAANPAVPLLANADPGASRDQANEHEAT